MLTIKKRLPELKILLEIISNMNTEAYIEVSPQQVRIQVLDLAAINLCDIALMSGFFDNYEVKESGIFKIDIVMLIKTIRALKAKELTINFKPDYLYIQSGNGEFKIKYYDTGDGLREIPAGVPTERWRTKTSALFDSIEGFVDFSCILKLISNAELSIETKSTLVEGAVIVGAVSEQYNNVCSYYDINYFAKIKTLQDIFENVSIQFSKDMPCIIKENNNGVSFKWIVASRTEDG